MAQVSETRVREAVRFAIFALVKTPPPPLSLSADLFFSLSAFAIFTLVMTPPPFALFTDRIDKLLDAVLLGAVLKRETS